MNFHASNEFQCPYCGTTLDTAAASHPDQKPQDGHYTICAECAGICIYVIKDGNVSMRKTDEKDLDYARQVGLWDEIEQMIDFVKSKPNK